MRTVLILMGRYLPGHKDGGPLRTIINVTEALGDEYDFKIVTLDRDHGDTVPYDAIRREQWNAVGKAKVWYVSPGEFTFKTLCRFAKEADMIYCCGFYDDYGYKTLILNRLGRLFGKPVVVASMGVFSPGALSQKSLKKKVFISFCKLAGLFRNIRWSVTSAMEEGELKRVIGASAVCTIAEDLPRTHIPGRAVSVRRAGDPLKIVFLSRICRMKNLLFAVRALQQLKVRAHFCVYGPKEDEEYWRQCEKELEYLPENVTWEYRGDVPSEQVPFVFGGHDVFLFPTKGENYGHVIFEALSAGCVPIISDQTPWQIVAEQQAGYVLSLGDPQVFADAVESFAALSAEKRAEVSRKAITVAADKVKTAMEETGYRTIFG